MSTKTKASEVIELLEFLKRDETEKKEEVILEAIRERQRKLDPTKFTDEKAEVKD